MDEKTYIYSRLRYLTEEVEHLTEGLNKQQDSIGKLIEIINHMQSHEYIHKQAQTAKTIELDEKLAMVRNILKNK